MLGVPTLFSHFSSQPTRRKIDPLCLSSMSLGLSSYHSSQYVERKTRSGREFTGAVDSHVQQTVAALSPQQLKDALPPLVNLKPTPLELPLSPAVVDKAYVGTNLLARKKYRCKAKRPRKESRQSMTNAGTHRRRQPRAAKRNEGGHRCAQRDCQAVVASSSPVDTGFKYSSIKVQTGGYGGIHLGPHAHSFPHGNISDVISHGYTLIPWDGKSSSIK